MGPEYSLSSYHMFLLALDSRKKKQEKMKEKREKESKQEKKSEEIVLNDNSLCFYLLKTK